MSLLTERYKISFFFPCEKRLSSDLIDLHDDFHSILKEVPSESGVGGLSHLLLYESVWFRQQELACDCPAIHGGILDLKHGCARHLVKIVVLSYLFSNSEGNVMYLDTSICVDTPHTQRG